MALTATTNLDCLKLTMTSTVTSVVTKRIRNSSLQTTTHQRATVRQELHALGKHVDDDGKNRRNPLSTC